MSPTSHEPSRTLEDLLAADDAAFLSMAYLWLLGRPVDPAGFRDYDARLRAGTPRLQVVAELRSSPEGMARGADLPGLAEAMAGFRTPAQRAVTRSVRGLFRLQDEQFVDAAALMVLGLVPSQADRQRWQLRLRAGLPRMALVGELVDRRGQRQLEPVEGLPELLTTLQSGLCPVAVDLDDLLSFHDEAFVDCAYKTLIGRRPDPDGLSHYTGLLRAGHSKLGIVARLCRSPEGRSRGWALPGLRPALQRYLVGRLPLLGTLFRALWKVDGESPAERRMRALDNKLERLLFESARQRLDAELASDAVDRLLGDGAPAGPAA